MDRFANHVRLRRYFESYKKQQASNESGTPVYDSTQAHGQPIIHGVRNRSKIHDLCSRIFVQEYCNSALLCSAHLQLYSAHNTLARLNSVLNIHDSSFIGNRLVLKNSRSLTLPNPGASSSPHSNTHASSRAGSCSCSLESADECTSASCL